MVVSVRFHFSDASSSGTNNLPLGNFHHLFSVLMAPSALANLTAVVLVLSG